MKTGYAVKMKTVVALAAGLAGAACGQSDGSNGHDMGSMQEQGMGAMTMDPALMHRHAAEMDSVVHSMRQHLDEVRRLSAPEWHARMNAHAPAVAHMVSVLERQTREMDMGMNVGDEVMGAMMGMSGEEHRTMVSEMQALRSEIGELQTAPEGEVQRRMPAHLDRIERMLLMMERSAAHMGTP